MDTLEVIVNKVDVYEEVAETTSYDAIKRQEKDKNIYQRIFTMDEDRSLIERFWVEASNVAEDAIRPFIDTLTPQPIAHGVELGRNFSATLRLPARFDTTLSESIRSGLYSFFVNAILAKWYQIAAPELSTDYSTRASAQLDDIKRRLNYRTPPRRRTPPED